MANVADQGFLRCRCGVRAGDHDIGFDDWDAFGVKAANVAVLGTLGFPEGTVPDGFAIPFYFYDEFMKHNGFYEDIEEMLADPDFQSDYAVQDDMLDDLRDDIEDGETPEWILEALETMNEGFAEGINRRYRSSTNNEDLPSFNGAGLYDSKSQKPSEDEEDGLDKSLKEVSASLWNFRAFIEREFHRVDHLAAAMGVLVHPSYKDELVNGVAVSFDPVSGTDDRYYVNSQVGEDLVTSPEAHSVPEELLLAPDGSHRVLATSNQAEPGQFLMTAAQLNQLHQHLTVIHDEFEKLYEPEPDEPFAMEIEFKITSDNILAIKQARPWVFSPASAPDGVPGAPLHLRVAPHGTGALELTWQAPSDDGGSAITGYTVQWKEASQSWNTTANISQATATGTTYTVTGLTDGQQYAFRVVASNSVGNGSASAEAAELRGKRQAAHPPSRILRPASSGERDRCISTGTT